MTIERKKKTISVDKKVKKKPVYDDKRKEPNLGGPLGIEFCELTPEHEAFCQLMADGTPKSQIMTLIPNMSRYKYKTWSEKDNIKERIEEIKAEALMQTAGHLEPAMVHLIMGLTRFFKVKAAMLDLNEVVADKVLDRAIDFCKALSPMMATNPNKNEPKGTPQDGEKQKNPEPAKVERKPLWSEADYEDVEQQEDDETDDRKEGE